MGDVSAFCLFCEDVRDEAHAKSSFIGVTGGNILIADGAKSIERLKAVCIARMPLDRYKSVKISIQASIQLDADTVSVPPEYVAEFAPGPDVDSEFWELQIVLDLKSMPIRDGAIATVRLSVEDASSTAYLSFTSDRDVMRRLTGEGVNITNQSGGEAKTVPMV